MPMPGMNMEDSGIEFYAEKKQMQAEIDRLIGEVEQLTQELTLANLDRESLLVLINLGLRNFRQYMNRGVYNWGLITKLYGLGSTSAKRLCERIGIDPDDVKL